MFVVLAKSDCDIKYIIFKVKAQRARPCPLLHPRFLRTRVPAVGSAWSVLPAGCWGAPARLDPGPGRSLAGGCPGRPDGARGGSQPEAPGRGRLPRARDSGKTRAGWPAGPAAAQPGAHVARGAHPAHSVRGTRVRRGAALIQSRRRLTLFFPGQSQRRQLLLPESLRPGEGRRYHFWCRTFWKRSSAFSMQQWPRGSLQEGPRRASALAAPQAPSGPALQPDLDSGEGGLRNGDKGVR